MSDVGPRWGRRRHGRRSSSYSQVKRASMDFIDLIISPSSTPVAMTLGRACGGNGSRRRRGDDVDIPRAGGRGDAAATMRIFRESRRRRGDDVDIPQGTGRGDAAAMTRIFRGRVVAAPRRRRRGYSAGEGATRDAGPARGSPSRAPRRADAVGPSPCSRRRRSARGSGCSAGRRAPSSPRQRRSPRRRGTGPKHPRGSRGTSQSSPPTPRSSSLLRPASLDRRGA